MFRLLSILAFGALCILPDRASADQLKPHESFGIRDQLPATVRVHMAWPNPCYNPLPYRFGTATVWGPPYRYYW
jgi:hypothetical protein